MIKKCLNHRKYRHMLKKGARHLFQSRDRIVGVSNFRRVLFSSWAPLKSVMRVPDVVGKGG